MKWNAIGIVEVTAYSNTVVVMDNMLKAADVRVCSFHKKMGGKMVRGIVAGEVSAVDAAIDAAEASRHAIGDENLKVAVNISNPHPEIIKLMNMMNDLLGEEPVSLPKEEPEQEKVEAVEKPKTTRRRTTKK
ncbi:MAG: BMC domain-containing protein [Lachnospiraceae bacterium]|nr:BMC domain-containing protein [Candidatus Equihabitans merdae]